MRERGDRGREREEEIQKELWVLCTASSFKDLSGGRTSYYQVDRRVCNVS